VLYNMAADVLRLNIFT